MKKVSRPTETQSVGIGIERVRRSHTMAMSKLSRKWQIDIQSINWY